MTLLTFLFDLMLWGVIVGCFVYMYLEHRPRRHDHHVLDIYDRSKRR